MCLLHKEDKMQFDAENKVFQLCARGMNKEAEGQPSTAKQLFQQAWEEATTDFEKLTAAHYVARHQESVSEKLRWDETALQLALKLDDETVKGTYPSLYLNIAKCHEDLNDNESAGKNYELALSYVRFLADDGYGKMIKGGIANGIERVAQKRMNSSTK
jgi:hypothetical protein